MQPTDHQAFHALCNQMVVNRNKKNYIIFDFIRLIPRHLQTATLSRSTPIKYPDLLST